MKVYLLNKLYSKIWYTKRSWLPWVAPERRVEIAQMILKEHPDGAMVANVALFVVAQVFPSGKIKVLPAPYKKVRMSDVCNKPTTLECQCAPYFYPSTGGPWKDTEGASRGEHHPICQFHKHAWENVEVLRKWGVRTGDEKELVKDE